MRPEHGEYGEAVHIGPPFCVGGAHMDKLKNPDIAALVAVGLALLVELASYLETNESALELLPAWVGPVVLGGAALARYVLSMRAATLTPAVAVPESPVATEVDGGRP